ncbi:phospholipase D-like domain-containing protein [Acidisphaera sp. L21]|jgi:cardiolipin synthase|uniref:phospholipase D-like domain-containing protein n=1 Tax=Acidisphaera sp. L21 TaxID=1641851 RepID=UPI00131CAE1A|nr:phospholipase D-like domain-containing protein [Acidisphaera sp. L21]
MNDFWLTFHLVRADVVFSVGLVVAACVTWHVLLRKREVASAVGWIGLAWFAPITGALVYFVFGVNRVQRRARRLRSTIRRGGGRSAWPSPGDDDHLDPLERGIGRITARPTLPGNALQILHDGDQGYPLMLEAIGQATRTVGLSSYIFHLDQWGTKFVDALAAAKDRGVEVRVLIDGIGGGWLRSPVYRALAAKGVTAARFLHSPLPWRMPFLNLRSHKKILVVDGRIGFTGGLNIADENVMATNPKTPVQDTHFRIDGPVVCQLTEAFLQDWSFATDEDLDGDAWFPDIDGPGDAPARIIDSGPDEDIEKIEFAVLQAVACARTSIAIMTPYFLPDERLMTALSLASIRGVSVDIVIPEISDHRFIDWATWANVGPLLSDGARIWRCPPPFRHSKVMVVDGEWSMVGSCNWDMRSFRLNFELCLEVYSNAFAETLSALMQSNRGKSLTQADLDGRTLPARLRDAGVRLMLPYL